MLDVRRMRVLREVAVRGSFSGAAEALSFTQSAVSQQIAALEREAGTVLVERGARGVRLTDAGHAVVRHAEAILARLAEAEAELEAIAGLRGGRLRMASFESAGASLMPIAIARFRAEHPAVDLSLALLEPADAVAGLRAGELELTLVFDGGTNAVEVGTDGIERQFLLDDPMYVALHPDHPLAHKSDLRLADLAADAWIQGIPGCECNKIVDRACQAAGFEPRVAFQADDYAAIQGLVAAGVGVGPIAELGLSTVRDDIVIRSFGDDIPPRRVHAAALEGGYRSPATTVMLELLQEVAAEYAARRSSAPVAAVA